MLFVCEQKQTDNPPWTHLHCKSGSTSNNNYSRCIFTPKSSKKKHWSRGFPSAASRLALACAEQPARLSLQWCEALGSTWPNSICSLIRNKNKFGTSTRAQHTVPSPALVPLWFCDFLQVFGPYWSAGSFALAWFSIFHSRILSILAQLLLYHCKSVLCIQKAAYN